MALPVLNADELMAWNDKVAQRWVKLMLKHPEIAALPCDIYEDGRVIDLFRHLCGVELRYAERLTGIEVTALDAMPKEDVQEIYAMHVNALELLRPLLADEGFPWQEEIEFKTQSMGRMAATREAVFHHLLLHSMRHYAQLATMARKQGISAGPQDYLMLRARRLPD
jgi:uncharacterized damage-inducible protein DinB